VKPCWRGRRFQGTASPPDGNGDGQGRDSENANREPPGASPPSRTTRCCGRCSHLRVTLGDPLQRVPEVARRLPAFPRVLRETAPDDPLQKRRGQRLKLRDRPWLGRHDRRDQAGPALALEGTLARHHLVQHCAEREDVCPGVRVLALQLLRGHVGVSPHDHPLVGEWPSHGG
jgi:hypothetical protein